MNYKHRTFSWINEKCFVKKTKTGNGVFTDAKIGKNEKICIFGGYILTHQEEVALGAQASDASMQIDSNFVIGFKSKKDTQASDFFNHSCDPNAGIKGQIFLVAMRDIEPGEQITFDYAMVLSKMKGAPRYVMTCNCQSKICRKEITEDDWKLPSLQKRYRGFFQWYIQEKIAKR